jgi:isoleucyl-tRNA synthetase
VDDSRQSRDRLHPDVDYVVADLGAERIIVAQALLGAVAAAAKIETAPPVQKILPAELEHLQPAIRSSTAPRPSCWPTTSRPTAAPARAHRARPRHGRLPDRPQIRLEIYCPVGDDGRYLDDGRMPADLVGLTTLETVEDLAAKKPAPANIAVLKKLAAAGALLAKQI